MSQLTLNALLSFAQFVNMLDGDFRGNTGPADQDRFERRDVLPLQNSMDHRSPPSPPVPNSGMERGAPGFRHENPTNSHRSQSHTHHRIEPGCSAEALGHVARDRGTDCGADAAEGSDNALPEVEPSGALRYVGDDQRS